MKIPKFKNFLKEDQKTIKENSKKLKDWTVGDVKKVEKQLKLVIKASNSLHKNKMKLEQLLDFYSGYKEGKAMNKVAFQENPTEFLDILKQMFPGIIK